jgi:thiamine biosynthesis protein ThiS
MMVTVNGNPEPLEGDLSVLGYLQARGLEPAHVVVEVNRKIVARDSYGVTILTDGDSLEVLRFVGGG